MDNQLKAARTMCRSNLRALLKLVDDSPRHGYLQHEKLGAFNALSGAARYARLIGHDAAAELLDKIADGLLDNNAMCEPESARAHLEGLLKESEDA